jgi:hypothetical protein
MKVKFDNFDRKYYLSFDITDLEVKMKRKRFLSFEMPNLGFLYIQFS